MAYESPGVDVGTFTAAADLSAKQYHFVVLASATTVNVATAITNAPIGILQNDPESGEQAVVRISGVSKVVADGHILTPSEYRRSLGVTDTFRSQNKGNSAKTT